MMNNAYHFNLKLLSSGFELTFQSCIVKSYMMKIVVLASPEGPL